jgi:hypothetical protein
MADDVNDSTTGAGRALVPVARAGTASATPAGARNPRPSAAFIAHLVATAQGAPQTRSRRRATADHAATLYAAAARKDRPSAVAVSM